MLLLSSFNLVIDDDFAGSSKGQPPVSASWFSSKSSKKVCDHEHLAVLVTAVNSSLGVWPYDSASKILFQIPLSSVTSIVDGLKRLYIQKLKPLEVSYRFNDFVSPLLVSGMYVLHFNCIFHYIFHVRLFLS